VLLLKLAAPPVYRHVFKAPFKVLLYYGLGLSGEKLSECENLAELNWTPYEPAI